MLRARIESASIVLSKCVETTSDVGYAKEAVFRYPCPRQRGQQSFRLSVLCRTSEMPFKKQQPGDQNSDRCHSKQIVTSVTWCQASVSNCSQYPACPRIVILPRMWVKRAGWQIQAIRCTKDPIRNPNSLNGLKCSCVMLSVPSTRKPNYVSFATHATILRRRLEASRGP